MYEETINEFKEELKENLISAIKFGSEGKPNNLLFVVNDLDFNVLEQIKELVIKHSKKINTVPLFFTKEELIDGSDVFPLEFLDIKQPHELLFGEDIINQIEFNKESVRRQLEFELRSKLIHLREDYIWIKKTKGLKQLLQSAVPSLMPLFYGLLFIKDVTVPSKLDTLFELVDESYEIDVSILRKVRDLSGGNIKVKDEDLRNYVDELITFLSQLGEIVDEMRIGEDNTIIEGHEKGGLA